MPTSRVDLSLIRSHRLLDPHGVFFDPSHVRLHTRPLDPAAVRDGHLPRGDRMFVLFRPRHTVVRRIVARDAAGHVVIDCAGQDCNRVPR